MDLGSERYVNLATFRRDGTEVRTPVWIAPDADRLIVWTNVNSFKVKRLRRDSRSRLAACNARGDVRGPWVDATTRVLDDSGARDRALQALFRKYGWQMHAARFFGTLSGRWNQRAALEVRL